MVRRTLDPVGRAREFDNLPAGLQRRLRNNAAEADAARIDPQVTDAYPGIVGALERLASPRPVSRAEMRSAAEGLVRDYGPVGGTRELILETRRDAAAYFAGRNALEAMGTG